MLKTLSPFNVNAAKARFLIYQAMKAMEQDQKDVAFEMLAEAEERVYVAALLTKAPASVRRHCDMWDWLVAVSTGVAGTIILGFIVGVIKVKGG